MMSSSSMEESCLPASTNVVIPSETVVVDHWVVSSGSAVRKGETIAFVRNKGEAAKDVPAAAAAPKHKRPSRRRKNPKPSAAAAVGKTNQAPSSVKSNAMSLKTILAGKSLPSPSEPPTTVSSSSTTTESIPKEKPSISSTKATMPIHAPATGILKILNSASEASSERILVIGIIEECLHPTFLDGMCVVCGAPRILEKGDPSSRTIQEASGNTTQVTVSGGVTMTVSQKESENMAVLDTDRLLGRKKLSLVLDLDHTLVHATSDARARQYLDPAHPQVETPGDVRTISLPMFEGATAKSAMDPRHSHLRSQHFVKLRPYVKEFLEGVKDTYEVSVYTAGTRQYAEEIAMVLCRKLAGSTMDSDDLERLRHRLRLAEEDYAKNQKKENKRTIDESSSSPGETDGDIEMTEKETKDEPPRKKKKVSFEVGEAVEDKGNDQQYEPMTKEKLESLQSELLAAEELEAQSKEIRQKVFGSRIVSRTDVGDLGRDVKSLKRVFPCGGTMAAVVDDREDVWANAKDNSDSTIKGEPPDNLLLVRPYHWQPFVGFADINNAAGKDLSGSSPGKTDSQLLWTKRILEQLHKRYYEQRAQGKMKTVPETLKEMRREVLRGSTMVLSGLVPLHKQSLGAGNARPHFVRYAQNLGATIQNAVDSRVTHVVAAKDGTDKALAARKIPGCMLVKSAWLMECFWSMTRRDPTPFLLHNVTPGNQEPPPPGMRESTVEQSSDSDFEDEFAAEFESEMMDTD